MVKTTNPKRALYPVYRFPDDKIIEMGNNYGKFLCIIKNQMIEPSSSSVKKLNDSKTGNRKRDLYCTYIDEYWDQRYFLFEKFDEGIKMLNDSWAT